MSLQTTKMASASKGVKRKDTTEENENRKADIKRSFQKEWLTKYAWLKYEMYCSVCKAFKKKNTLTSGSTNFRTSTLVRHIESRDHRESVIARQSAQQMEMMNKEIFFQRRSISDSSTGHLLCSDSTNRKQLASYPRA